MIFHSPFKFRVWRPTLSVIKGAFCASAVVTVISSERAVRTRFMQHNSKCMASIARVHATVRPRGRQDSIAGRKDWFPSAISNTARGYSFFEWAFRPFRRSAYTGQMASWMLWGFFRHASVHGERFWQRVGDVAKMPAPQAPIPVFRSSYSAYLSPHYIGANPVVGADRSWASASTVIFASRSKWRM